MKINTHTITRRFYESVELAENEKIGDRLHNLRQSGFDIIDIRQPQLPERTNLWQIIYRKFLRLPEDVKTA